MVMNSPNKSSRASSPTHNKTQEHQQQHQHQHQQHSTTTTTTTTTAVNNNQRKSISFPLRFRRHRRRQRSDASTKSESVFASPASSLRKRIRRVSTLAATDDVLLLSSEDEGRDDTPHATIRTSILGSYEPVQKDGHTFDVMVPNNISTLSSLSSYDAQEELPCQATAILQHSFVGCGLGIYQEEEESKSAITIPDDPTVQESFECVFASQLEDGLPHEALWEEGGDNNNDDGDGDGDETTPASTRKELMSPALLLQTRTSSRLRLSNLPLAPGPKPLQKPRRTFRTGSLVHIGTYDPVSDRMSTEPPAMTTESVDVVAPVAGVAPESRAVPNSNCSCCAGVVIPQLSPADWPQCPLLFRPTPGSGMRVKGIKFANSDNYLWKVGDNHTWVQALHERWGKSAPAPYDLGCPECMVLPINNGNEAENESLVVDFISPLFEGSILLRLRHCEGSTAEPYKDDVGYFAGVNRRYQVVIQGKPLCNISMTQCVTGWELRRPCGKLPPRWILKSVLKLVSFFAPQMEAVMDGPHPKTISPLGSTPQMLKVNYGATVCQDLESNQEEPTVPEETLLGVASRAPTTLARAKFRKKNFDKLYTQRSPATPVLSPSKTYTFEFLQHLLNFTNFTVEMGSLLGSIPLKELLDGQALQIMAKHNTLGALWSFDVWHEELYADAQRHEQ